MSLAGAPRAGAAGGTDLVTSFTPSALRNDFNGWVGMRVQGGSSDLSVSELGRWVVAGNTQSHPVRLVNAATGTDVATATVATSGQPAGAFAFTALASPVTLLANTTYYLLSQEFAGGDTWYDYNTSAVTTSDASGTGVVWTTTASPSTFNAGGAAGMAYGVPNLRYSSVNAAPAVTQQPTNQTVTAGNTAVFTAAASGVPTPTVQWQSMPPAGSFANIGGATSTVLSIPATTVGMSGTQYRAVFSNSSGAPATTAAATLTVNASPPAAGDAFVTYFSPSALRNDFSGWVGMRIQGGATDISVKSLGRWVVAGNSQAHTVRLINAGTGTQVATAGVTTSGQPAGAFAFTELGSPVTLLANTTYYLLSEEFAGGDTWYDYNTATITTAAASDTGVVWATAAAPSAFNAGGSAGQSFGVPNLRYTTTNAAPAVTQHPADTTVTAGGTAVFTAAASGVPTPTVQWQSKPPAGSFANISGATSSILSVPSVTAGMNGTEYQAVFSNSSGGPATTDAATLTVNAAPPAEGTALVTYFTPSALRNDFSGWVGMRIQVGVSNLSVNSLGRWVVAGNSQAHPMRLVTTAGADVATATVVTSGQPAGAFAFTALGAPVTLSANTTYYLLSQEFAGGDTWYDYNTATITTSAASDTGVVWAMNATPNTFNAGGSAGQSYGVPNLRYTVLNSIPTAVADGPYTVAEDGNLTVPVATGVLANDADADAGDTLIAILVSGPGHAASFTLNADGSFSYTPVANYNGPDSFTYKANDSKVDSNTVTASITVTAANDAPTITLSGSAPSFTEDGSPVTVDGGLTVADVDDTDLVSGSVTITAGTVAGDTLTFTPGPSGITDTNGAADVLALSGTATVAQWQTVLQSVQFSTTSQTPGTSRTIRFVVNDGDVNSNQADKTVIVVPVNDPPTVNLDAATPLAYNENAGFTNLFGAAAAVADVDSATLDSLAVTISSGFDATFDTLDLNTAGFGTNFTGGVLTITKAGGTSADFTTALRNVRFNNTDDDPDDRNDGTPNPSVANRTVSVVADDGPDTSTPVTRNIVITPVNDPPSAPTTAPTTAGVRNTTLVSGTNSVTGPKVTRTVDFEGDSVDPDGLESAITVVPAAAAPTNQSGRITLDASGNLVYEPPASGTLASDTYSYQLTDGITPTPVTFTVNLSGAVWYVADGVAGTQDGTAARPFDLVSEGISAAAANQTVHVRGATGDGVLSSGVTLTLKSGMKLIGEGVALTNTDVGSSTAETIFAAGTKPQLTASGADVITLAANAQVAGVTVNPDGLGGGIFGNAVAGVTLRDMNVDDTGTAATQPGIELTGTGNGLTFSGTVNLTTTQAGALAVAGSSLSGTIASTTVTGSTNSAGVSLTNTTGSLTFTTLAITTTNQTGFLLNNADSIDVAAGTVASTNRPAVDAIGLDNGSDLTFTDVDSTNSTSDGINLDGTGTWTFTAPAGSSISGAATVALDVNGGSGIVSYAGSIANSATGEAVDVTGRSGNTTISGNITGTGGTGVNVSGNTAGTTTFSGTTKTLNTGTNAAVTLNNSGSHAVVFSNGGLDIDTTSGAGFSATGGASLIVTGSTNTIDSTTTGTALNVANTSIAAGGLSFRSISAGSTAPGPTNGIVLNNTGTAAGLTVPGTGADGTGGTIARTTGDAVSLTSTRFTSLSNMIIGDSTATAGQTPTATNHIGGDGIDMNNADDVTLNNMRIARTGNHGIDGTGVTNLSLTNSEIYNAGDANGDSAFAFNDFGANQTNLDGTVTVTNTVFDGMVENGIDIENFGGTLNMTVSGSRFANNASTLCSGSTCGENGLLARADGTSVINLTVNNNGATKTLFDGIDGNGLFMVSEGSSATPSTLNVTQTTIQNSTAIGMVLFGGTGDHTSTIQSRFNFTVGGSAGSGVSITGNNATAMSIQPNGKSIMRGTVSHLNINGSTVGRGIEVLSDDVSTSVIDINNNTVSNTAFNGIFASNGDSGVLDIHIRSNNVSAPLDAVPASGLAVHGIEVNPLAEASTTCLDIASNTSAGNAASAGAGFRTRQRDPATFRLERFTGSATSVSDVQAFLVAQNSSGTASATVNSGYTGVANGACADV